MSRILRLRFRLSRNVAQDSTLSVVLSLSKDEAEGSNGLQVGFSIDIRQLVVSACLIGSTVGRQSNHRQSTISRAPDENVADSIEPWTFYQIQHLPPSLETRITRAADRIGERGGIEALDELLADGHDESRSAIRRPNVGL